MLKILESVFHPPEDRTPGPFYYPQSSDFTCGAAALIMAMKAVKPELVVSRELEYDIWREANTMYMGSGHPGTNPFGLALSARRRGLEAAILVNGPENLFATWNRKTEKRLLSRALSAYDFLTCHDSGVPIYEGPFTADDLRAFGQDAAIVILTGSGVVKHWELVIDIVGETVTLHDPWRDKASRSETHKSMFRSVPGEEFEKSFATGAHRAQAAIIVHRGNPRGVPKTVRKSLADSFADKDLLNRIAEYIPVEIAKRKLTDFTCGAHCLCLLQKERYASRHDFLMEELKIWREANMVFAGSAMPGCGPYGLALSAVRRGLRVALWGNNIVGLLLEKTKDPTRREIQAIMEGWDRSRLLQKGVPVSEGRFGMTELRSVLARGARVVLMVDEGRFGHWVLLGGIDGKRVRYVDPWVSPDEEQSMPIDSFRSWMKFGPRNSQAALIVYPDR